MTATTFGSVLKEWRGIRRMSQLDLSNAAEVSARHISFLESGRSRPSRPMAVHLADALEIPRGERNRLLSAAGFAPMWSEHDLDSDEMQPILRALEWTLDRHDPYPAMVIDRHWNVVRQNRTSQTMLGALGLVEPVNFLQEMTQPGGVRDLIDNWPTVGRFMLSRLRTESAALGGDDVLDQAIADLVDDPEIRTSDEPFPPIVNVDLRIGDTCLALFSTIAQFGTAEDLAIAELRIELFFPADEPTRSFFELLAG
ncbi:MAG: helix-turn-helix transcriptional regulator [Actinomycetota bacterium]